MLLNLGVGWQFTRLTPSSELKDQVLPLAAQGTLYLVLGILLR